MAATKSNAPARHARAHAVDRLQFGTLRSLQAFEQQTDPRHVKMT
jgi:hypothetical protein